ncbi:MAG: CCA tRNA nucleotidyltransferase [Alphaproteobacteria bacterium]
MENFKQLIKPFEKIINTITLAGGRFIFVGGCVRDVFLNISPKDVDAEVYGIPLEEVKQALELVDIVSQVGKQFGVLKLKNYPIDISLPRFETKTGPGHKGFSIKVDYSISFKQAAKRRDLTINAIGFDPIKNEILDPYNGVSDIYKGILREVDPHTFIEDPLRGLRVAQFSSRFLMDPHKSLIDLCKTLNLHELPVERTFGEVKKLLLLGQKPSKGMSFLKETGLLKQLSSTLDQLNCASWDYSLEALDRAVSLRPRDEEKSSVLMITLLCSLLSHDEAQTILKTCPIKEKQKEQIFILLEKSHRLFENRKVADSANLFWMGYRLHKKNLCWHDLLLLLKIFTDHAPWVIELSKQVLASGAAHPKNLKPVVGGDHLIKKGLRPGKEFNDILKKCLKIQYEQRITDPDKILEKIL